MSDILNNTTINNLNIHNSEEAELIQKCSYALSSPERIRIMQSLSTSKSLSNLSNELNIPLSSLSRHIDILADSKLIYLYYKPGPKGHAKYASVAPANYSVIFDYNKSQSETPPIYSVELPVGMFSHCHIERPCGMLGKEKQLIPFDSPNYFFNPERLEAECLWFDRGFISYNFPTPPVEFIDKLSSITFSFEICSETDYYNNNWPSDITIIVNKKELLTFTSPGDFGGRRGKYTPDFWPISSTQFGLLKKVKINKKGVFFDNQLVNKHITFNDLDLFDGSAIQLTIGIKDDAIHKGGINLFGKNFGDFPQAIIMTLTTDIENTFR